MNPHLSSDQISEWILGRRSPEIEQHVRECPGCDAELVRCQSALAAFGQSAREWADRQETSAFDAVASEAAASSARPAWIAAHSNPPVRPWPWAIAVAAVAMAVGIPTYKSVRDADLDARSKAEQEDARLLEQIDTQLSRMVPMSMEPLLELMQEDEKETPQ